MKNNDIYSVILSMTVAIAWPWTTLVITFNPIVSTDRLFVVILEDLCIELPLER